MNPYVVATDASRPPPGHLSDGVMRALEHMEHVDTVIVTETGGGTNEVESDLVNDYIALAGGRGGGGKSGGAGKRSPAVRFRVPPTSPGARGRVPLPFEVFEARMASPPSPPSPYGIPVSAGARGARSSR